MNHPDCSYCTRCASGIDDDGELTCGDATTCSAAVGLLPSVIEISGDELSDFDESSPDWEAR